MTPVALDYPHCTTIAEHETRLEGGLSYWLYILLQVLSNAAALRLVCQSVWCFVPAKALSLIVVWSNGCRDWGSARMFMPLYMRQRHLNLHDVVEHLLAHLLWANHDYDLADRSHCDHTTANYAAHVLRKSHGITSSHSTANKETVVFIYISNFTSTWYLHGCAFNEENYPPPGAYQFVLTIDWIVSRPTLSLSLSLSLVWYGTWESWQAKIHK